MTITPNPDSIRAVIAAREPRCRKEVECYLGQICALTKWFPRLNVRATNTSATLTKGRHFEWDSSMQDEFNAVKEQLKEPSILSHFDMNKKNLHGCLQIARSWVHTHPRL